MSQLWTAALFAAAGYLLYRKHQGLSMSAVEALEKHDPLSAQDRYIKGAPQMEAKYTSEREIPRPPIAPVQSLSGTQAFEPIPLNSLF